MRKKLLNTFPLFQMNICRSTQSNYLATCQPCDRHRLQNTMCCLWLEKMKKTKSTLPIDIPEKFRQECAPHLVAPLSNIINDSLSHSIYPSLWKHEWVTLASKLTNPQEITDLRKISCTRDYSKLFEGFLKDWIMEDVCDNIDI